MGLEWAPEGTHSGREEPTRRFQAHVRVGNHVFHVDNNFQQSLVVWKPSEEEAAATHRKCTAQILNLALLSSVQSTRRQDRLWRLVLPICVTRMFTMSVVDVSHLFENGRRSPPLRGEIIFLCWECQQPFLNHNFFFFVKILFWEKFLLLT